MFLPRVKVRLTLAVVAATAMTAAVLIVGVTPAVAANANASITAASPTYNHVNPGTCNSGSTATHYVEIPFTTGDGTNQSSINITVKPSGFRAFITLYSGGFLPGTSGADCYNVGVEGSGSGATVSQNNLYGLPNKAPGSASWDLVVSGDTAADIGSLSATITSNNGVTLGTAPPPPTDTTPPKITVPSNITANATSAAGADVTFSATATDNVDGTDPVTCSPASGSLFPLDATITVTCNAVDNAGNHATPKKFTVKVSDLQPPTIQVPGAINAEATSSAGASVTYSVTATDTVDGTDPVVCNNSQSPFTTRHSGDTFPIGTTTLVCRSTDAHGNVETGAMFSITVHDTTKPVVSKPADQVVEATSSSGAVATFTLPTATDAVGAGPVTCDHNSGATYPIGATTVTCSSSDAAGNKGSSTFKITVADTTAPMITVPGEVTDEATGPTGATVTYSASATDAVDGTDPVTCSPASGSVFPVGSTKVTCMSTDAHQNKASASFNVIVTDKTGPVLTLPSSISAEATGPTGAAVPYTATASDLVDGSEPVMCDHVAGSTFALGTTTVHCSASDASGNKTTGSFTVTIVDTTGPAFSAPADLSVEATGPSGAAVTYTTPNATDLVDGTVPVDCLPQSGTTFALGKTTVTCRSSDAHQNVTSKTFTVTVTDTTPPQFTAPGDITVEATGPSGAVATYATPNATDLVDGTDPVHCAPESGTAFVLGTTTVTCTSTDAHANVTTKTFTVTVQDTTGPQFTAPDDVFVEATGPAGALVSYTTPTATDTVDGTVPVSCAPASGGTFAIGFTTVSCSSSDAHLNTSTKTFVVSVTDTTPPTFTAPGDLTVEATGPTGAAVSYTTPSATDAVDGTDPVDCSPASGTTFPLGDSTVTCTATDAHANITTKMFTVTVHDTTAPVLSQPNPVTQEATGADGAAVTYDPPTVTDAVGAGPVVCSPPSGSTFPLGDSTVTCTSTDAAGNVGTVSFDVHVVDTTGPVIAVPAHITRSATSVNGAPVTYSVTATDAVNGPVPVSCTPASGTEFAVGTTTVTCTASDPASTPTAARSRAAFRLAGRAIVAAPATTTATFLVTVRPFASPTSTPPTRTPVQPAPGAPAPNGTGNNVASTGANIVGLLVIALGCLCLGVLLNRRRPRGAHRAV